VQSVKTTDALVAHARRQLALMLGGAHGGYRQPHSTSFSVERDESGILYVHNHKVQECEHTGTTNTPTSSY